MDSLPTLEPLCSECKTPIKQKIDDYVMSRASEDPYERRLQFTHVDCYKPSPNQRAAE